MIVLGLLILSSLGRAEPANAPDRFQAPDPFETNFFEVQTPHGSFVVMLYDDTPIHRDNFRRLASEAYYDGTTFHRVIEGFMIQGGDPNSRDEDPFNDGEGGPGYTLEAEFVAGRFHKRGAVAAARTSDGVNPDRRSSGSQFYVVQGATFDDATLDRIEQHIRSSTGQAAFAFADSVRTVYRELGGTPNLDQQYTVFAEVVEGLDVVDVIAGAMTPRKSGRNAPPEFVDRPFDQIPMTVRPLPGYGP